MPGCPGVKVPVYLYTPLNSIAHGTSPAFSLHAQHPSGAQYADFLSALATDANPDVNGEGG